MLEIQKPVKEHVYSWCNNWQGILCKDSITKLIIDKKALLTNEKYTYT